MSLGPLDANETIGFTQDRFNNPNGAVYMNPGYYYIPSGLDFNTSFSFLVWVKVLAFNPYSRVIDCGNGPSADNIIVSLANGNTQKPYTMIYRGGGSGGYVTVPNNLPINAWFHLATVYDGQNLMIFVNGNVVVNSTKSGPNLMKRTKCYIGRSNFHVGNGDPDASACFDDLMLFNRSLGSDEIQNCMNTNFI
jgi:hypothetical protein